MRAFEMVHRGLAEEEVREEIERFVTEKGLTLPNDLSGDVLEFATAVHRAHRSAVQQRLAELEGNHLLIAGPLPPHFLDLLLESGLKIVQVDTGPRGDEPPHFRHLRSSAFTGFTTFDEAMTIDFASVLFHGFKVADEWLVHRHARFAVRIVRDRPVYVVPADAPHPHFEVAVDGAAVLELVL